MQSTQKADYCYKKSILNFSVNKEGFGSGLHYLYLFEKLIILTTSPNDSNPKIKLHRDYRTLIEWKVKKNSQGKALILEGFGIRFENKTIFFSAPHEKLYEFKNAIAGSVIFRNITDFYIVDLDKQIGSGVTCQVSINVISIVSKQSDMKYASKIIAKNDEEDEENISLKCFEFEFSILSRLQHENIVRLFEVYENDEEYFLILEYLQGGSLQDIFDQNIKLTISETAVIVYQLISALVYMDAQNFIHRDLKPSNIMFQQKGNFETLKIIDFGMATSTQVDFYFFSSCGTPGYIAPEVANLDDPTYKYGTVCDIFSVGSLFYKMLTTKDLFPGRDVEEVFSLNSRCILEGLYSLPQYEQTPNPQATKDLLKRMLSPSVKNRITAKMAIEHAFFKDIQLQQTAYSSISIVSSESELMQEEIIKIKK